MAIENNTPNDGYIFIKDLVIKYEDKLYSINSIYTKDKYVYWDINSPNDLITSNNKVNDINILTLVNIS